MRHVDVDVVTFGEAMAMFIADHPGELHEVAHFTRSLAGAETNVAVGLSRLGYRVRWVSKVGQDPFGQFILDALAGEGIDTSCVNVDDRYPTGFQLKSKVLQGDPRVQYFRKGSAASTLHPNDFAEETFTEARHLHMTGIPAALSDTARAFSEQVLQTMKQAGKTVSFDPNLRPNLWRSQEEMVQVVNGLAAQADWILPGQAEGEILTGYKQPCDIAAFYLERGASLVAVKIGPDGAYLRTATEEHVVSGYPVQEVVDTVGAGDGFAVGMLSGLFDGLSAYEAVQRGNAIGALAVLSPGDMDGLPGREELFQFMNQHKRGVAKHEI